MSAWRLWGCAWGCAHTWLFIRANSQPSAFGADGTRLRTLPVQHATDCAIAVGLGHQGAGIAVKSGIGSSKERCPDLEKAIPRALQDSSLGYVLF